jgi:L-aminopeptidase/D-esterase-like protein
MKLGTAPTLRPSRGRATLVSRIVAASLVGLVGLPLMHGGGELVAQRPGPTNSITDVPGLRVGHDQRVGGGYRTGTTVVIPERGGIASYNVQGGGPGTKETDLLVPGGLVTSVHAIVLSGGSAFGLDTATGVMRWLEERNVGYPVTGGVVPIVPAAILFDLGRGGDFQARPDADFGYRAAEAATSGPVASGRIGAGTGARYGLGTASVVLPNGYTVAAIVALNPGGSPIDPSTCLPLGRFLELEGEFMLNPPEAGACAAGAAGAGTAGVAGVAGVAAYAEPFNTTIAVVATDAPIDQTQAQRMAMIANSGLSRSIRPVHNLGDGDAVFALSTAESPAPLTLQDLHQIFNAAADALGRAVVHALLADGAYCDGHPGVCEPR